MKVNTRSKRTHKRLLDISPGTLFLAPSKIEGVPDYEMLRVFSHVVDGTNLHAIAVRISDGWVMAVPPTEFNTVYHVIPDAELSY